ncbi:MAG: ribonuclease III domain-containing protein [Clostridia bacterium]|nr:ribonuclease III domain-containing protein [Clostridia bacterium]
MSEFALLEGLEYERPDQVSAPALAFIGDAVYDLYIRGLLISEGIRNTGRLHRGSVGFVKASRQRKAYENVLGILTETELMIAKRGRNANMGSTPKNADPADYSLATAFETLLGYLYLMNDSIRLLEILRKATGDE